MNNKEMMEVKKALNDTHSPTTNQAKRKELYELIESKTCDPFKCKRMGFYFIRCTEDHLRLFGFHCIRKMAKRWHNLQSKDRNELKNLSLTLFRLFNTDDDYEKKSNFGLFKEKISEFIVLLASQTWPNEWKDLFKQLFKSSQSNPISLEILFIILKDIYFICGDRQIIQERRKKRIKDELMKNSQAIIQIFAVTLSQCYQQIFIDNNDINNSNKNPNIILAQNILRQCLQAMPKYLNQFPLKIILDSQVLIGLVKILQSIAQTSNNRNVPYCYDEFYRFGLLSVIYFFMRKFSELNSYETVKEFS